MTREDFLFEANGWVPNHPTLPVVVYRAVEPGDREEIARAFETRFTDHGWPPDWRDTVYDYHHYHSTAHEALGVAAGNAVLEPGGPAGRRVEVSAGDGIVLPAGTGHRRIEASGGFLVVGAYPAGQKWDICRNPPSPKARERIRTLPYPAQDPVTG